MELGGFFGLERVVITISASPSTITSLRPKSLGRIIPSFAAFASTSRAPKRRGSFLLIAPISWPLSFLITTPNPQQLDSLNTAPSMFVPSRSGRAPLDSGLVELLRTLGGGHGTFSKLLHVFSRVHRNTFCLFAPALVFEDIFVIP